MKFCVIPCCIKSRSTPKKRTVESSHCKRTKHSSIDFTSETTQEVTQDSNPAKRSLVCSKYYYLTTLDLPSSLRFINLCSHFSSHNVVVVSESLEISQNLSKAFQQEVKDTKSDRIFRDIHRTYCFCIEKELDYFLSKHQTDTVVIMNNYRFESIESVCDTIENLQWEFVRGIVLLVNNLNEFSAVFRDLSLDYKIIK